MTVDPETWPELRSARETSASAQAAWHAAQLAFWRAPAGKKREREAALTRATNEALRADLEVARLTRLTGGRA